MIRGTRNAKHATGSKGIHSFVSLILETRVHSTSTNNGPYVLALGIISGYFTVLYIFRRFHEMFPKRSSQQHYETGQVPATLFEPRAEAPKEWARGAWRTLGQQGVVSHGLLIMNPEQPLMARSSQGFDAGSTPPAPVARKCAVLTGGKGWMEGREAGSPHLDVCKSSLCQEQSNPHIPHLASSKSPVVEDAKAVQPAKSRGRERGEGNTKVQAGRRQ